MYLQRMLDSTTIHRFTVGKLTVALDSFGLNLFTLGPFLAFASVVASTFSGFVRRLVPFDLDPSPTFNQDLTFPTIHAFATTLDPSPMNSFTVHRIIIPLDPHQVVLVIALQLLLGFE